MALTLQINGESVQYEGEETVAALLVDLGIKVGKVAVEHNLEIVPRSAYSETRLRDGDRLEIVHFIGGGR